MKILQVITRSELGGAQTVVVQLANALCREHQVILAAGEGDGKMWDMVDNRVVREHCPHLQRALSPKNDLLAAIELRRLYKKHKPDVVHLHSSKAGVLGRLVFPSKRTIYTVHGFDSVRIAFRKFLPVERTMQHFSRATVGVSNYDRKNLISERINKNIHTIYNGICRPDCSQMQQMEIFDKYDKIILTIARLSPPKDPKLFIETARLLPNYGFVWIGNQEEVTQFGEIPSNCHFLGNIVNAGAYCSKADIFMLPSNYEGLPMVIIEAMSFGKPVVASNVGGVSEIVRNGENGYVLDNSPELFAQHIATIIEDKELYDRFAEASLQIYNSELTIDKMVGGYMELYKQCK